ncbi:hypothetical protein [Bernardetia sp.]|uniref:hypothetical protein n=1 Tax=Bernardetia sp. TaxID=1937974 RepID=UPI0025C07ACB|nr:hypothetical protein [Bernardetia sp.]
MLQGLEKLFFWRKKQGEDESKKVAQEGSEKEIKSFKYPISGGLRSSSVSTKGFGFGDKEREIYPEFALEWIPILKNLSVYDRNVGRAVNNSVSLAQTSYQIELPDNLSKRDRKNIMETLRIFERDAKIDAFTRNAIRTVMYAGGIAVEGVLVGNPYASAVKRLAILDITNIRFNYNPKTDEFIPKQINVSIAGKSEIILRKETFFYECVNQLDESPYPVPMLLSAIEDIITQKDMLENFKIIIKKLGMMGFLEVLITAPTQEKGETDEAYYKRCEDHIYQAGREIQQGLDNGFAVGFKTLDGDKKYVPASEFKMNATNINFGGAEKAFEIINRLLNNGLNTDGVFMNHNNNTSETFARVLLQVLIGNIDSIQKTVASILSDVFLLHLKLQGFTKLDWVKVVFEKPLIGDSLKEAQTEATRISNVISKVTAGIIDDDMAAQELGYEKASGIKQESPTRSPKVEVEPDNNTNPDKDVDVSLSKKKDFGRTDFGDDYLTKNASNYSKVLERKYKSASKKLIKLVKENIEVIRLQNETDLVTIFFLTLEQNWETLFTENIQTDIENYTQKVYRKYRKDTSIFPKEEEQKTENTRNLAHFVTPPEVVEDFLDIRLIEYLAESDSFYLGKFITDEAAKRRITQMLLDFYVANDGEIGNSDTLREFTELMQEQMEIEEFQIRRIVETTMTNARNFAHIKYLHQAEIKQFRRVEIGDRLTCSYCQAMDGDIYEVATEIRKAEVFVSSTPEEIVDISPFATTIDIDSFKSMSAAERQAAGIGAQAAHPKCRGRIVAVIN